MRLYHERVAAITTDASGLVTLTGLDAGSYVTTEISVPDGFILDMTPQIVALKAGESKQIELYNAANRELGNRYPGYSKTI